MKIISEKDIPHTVLCCLSFTADSLFVKMFPMRLLARVFLLGMVLSVVLVKPTAVTHCTTPPVMTQTDPCAGTYTIYTFQQPVTNLTILEILTITGFAILLALSHRQIPRLVTTPLKEVFVLPQTPPPRLV